MANIKKTLALTILSVMFFSLAEISNTDKVTAQPKSTSLLSMQCIKSQNDGWHQTQEDVSVARQIYTSKFIMSPSNYFGGGIEPAGFTCKLEGARYQNLQLAFGIPDNSKIDVPQKISLYVDGQETHSKIIMPGEGGVYNVDVSKAQNITLETACTRKSNRCGGWVYFFDATLTSGIASNSFSNSKETTLLKIETSNKSVRIFSQNGSPRINVYNKHSQSLELRDAPISIQETSSGKEYLYNGSVIFSTGKEI
jgi:hypothetical protein